jgi:hypothetical protein
MSAHFLITVAQQIVLYFAGSDNWPTEEGSLPVHIHNATSKYDATNVAIPM